MTSLAPRSMPMLLRSASRRASTAALRPLSTTSAALRASGIGPTGANAPPMEPHKQRVPSPKQGANDLGVGELEGAKFRVEPLRRVGEDDRTMRARLIYQSRKRGTLESDLLLSTFADTNLPAMTREQMEQYDKFLDENDWDIYYWATQEPPTSNTAASPAPGTTDTSSPTYGSASETLTATTAATASATTTTTATGGQALDTDALESKGSNAAAAAAAAAASEEPYRKPGEGEWAQTVGTFKPAYRPVPARWRDSEVLALLREHVRDKARERGGMAFMPRLR